MNYYSSFMGGDHHWAVALLMLWTIPWKGWALWRAAKREQKAWFVALLVLNTAGLLEILYIFVFSKDGEKKKPVGEARKS